jgi:SAM-dependent methyltransferase
MRLMKEFIDKYLPSGDPAILDVGSYDVNGSYKPLLAGKNYTGLDIEAGPNVDIVEPESYNWKSIKDATYDVVISGQCLEHVPAPWLWIKEVARVAKPGAMIIILAPWNWVVHYHPYDCWRVLPDGMRELFKSAGLRMIETGMDNFDTYGIGIKV